MAFNKQSFRDEFNWWKNKIRSESVNIDEQMSTRLSKTFFVFVLEALNYLEKMNQPERLNELDCKKCGYPKEDPCRNCLLDEMAE